MLKDSDLIPGTGYSYGHVVNGHLVFTDMYGETITDNLEYVTDIDGEGGSEKDPRVIANVRENLARIRKNLDSVEEKYENWVKENS